MSVKTALSLACVVATLSACSGGGQSTEQKAAPPAEPKAAAPAAVAAGDFGVPECDEYMKKYIACVDSKVPEAARAMLRQQLDQTKEAWKKAASSAEGKAGLSVSCKQMDATSKQAMTAYGCTW